MSAYYFSMLSDSEKEAIRAEARKNLARFGKILESVKDSSVASLSTGTLRGHGESSSTEDFRERMFANAPKKTSDCIVAEKASW